MDLSQNLRIIIACVLMIGLGVLVDHFVVYSLTHEENKKEAPAPTCSEQAQIQQIESKIKSVVSEEELKIFLQCHRD